MADYEFHEIASIFPLSEEKIAELAEDFATSPMNKSIELFEGKIIDGRHRYLACKRAGIRPHFVDVRPSDPIRYAVQCNLKRNHYSPTQLSMCAGKVRDLYDQQAKERQQVRKGRQAGSTVENLPQLDSGKARDKAGELFGVSGKSVDHATKVLKQGTPELVAAVESDLIAVSTAARVSSLSEDEQNALVERAKDREKHGKPPKSRPAARAAEVEDEEEPDLRPTVALRYANEAIECLGRIPKNDRLRKRGFQIVSDWLRRNR